MADDRGARLVACCWSMAAAAGILLAMRIYCKLWRSKGLWWDDYILIASWTSLVISVSINTYIVSLGFGQHIETISDDNLREINKCTILVALFGIVATTTSKTSFALTLYRIVIDRWIQYFLIFAIITINISMNLVWIFGFAKCTPLAKVWDRKVPGTCWDKNRLVKFQLFAAYYSAILDFVLALLPWKIIMGMTMRLREKIGVAVAMSLGAIAGITGIVKAVLVVNMTSPDITYDRVDLTIWTLSEPAASIMAISIPILRMFFLELRSSQRDDSKDLSYRYQLGGSDAFRSHAATDADARRSRMCGFKSKYGGNLVIVTSNSTRPESQEALQDLGSGEGRVEEASSQGGVLKTEEVEVHRESASDEGSIELKAVNGAGQRRRHH
ncbi:hypothetical protein GMORB2_1236 [Geosmithia morbida]|uniref:Rhodopsin domain-containing protein n=1 Tax=Geosmithia morbida TaxID=1094350 RepID=A0A9P5D7P8_9HYPO|nr:uncharacterized protein GMORB2_1236 [Geosmithia morbida]KAF4125990.1 hypothetical protein GMORB2_1236 [Geosmithia morbida]